MNKVRKGVTQAQFNKEYSGLLGIEFLIISVTIGYYYSSWWAFLGTFIFLYILLTTFLSIIIILILSVIWAIIPAYFAYGFWGRDAGAVIGIIAFISSYAAHKASLDYFNDLG